MRLLLLQDAIYFPNRGGVTKANRLLLEEMCSLGHACMAVAAAAGALASGDLRQALSERAIEYHLEDGVCRFVLNNVLVNAVMPEQSLQLKARTIIEEFQPDWILVSSEDFGQRLLRAAARYDPNRIVYIAHTLQFLPFGPASFWPNRLGSELLHRVRAIVTISAFVKDYLETHGQLGSTQLRFPLFGKPPIPLYTQPFTGFITMVNPSLIKGLSIFCELAKAFPELPFAAVASWGTTNKDLETLSSLSNVTVLPAVDDVESIYSRTRILVAPSIWYESFGLVVIEAMLRGIPVIASDTGGLKEAKLGTDYALHVNPIIEYLSDLDENQLPIPIVPDQDIRPWITALGSLAGDSSQYRELARESRARSMEYARGADIRQFESFLCSLS